MNLDNKTSSAQSDLEIAAAPFLAFGILYCIGALLPLIILPAVFRSFEYLPLLFPAAMLFSGLGLVAVGIGLRRQWRFILPLAAVVCIPGLLQFPIGTLLYGWALRSLWIRRELFYPFDRPSVPKA